MKFQALAMKDIQVEFFKILYVAESVFLSDHIDISHDLIRDL